MDFYQHKTPLIGEVYLVDFSGGDDCEQRGVRPGLILQNNTGNQHSPNVIVLPLTTAIKKANMPTHVLLPSADTGLLRDSMALCENPKCISKNKLGKFLTNIPKSYMSKIAIAHLLATSAIAFVNPEFLKNVWEIASKLNTVAA